jgi:hypothetical protein
VCRGVVASGRSRARGEGAGAMHLTSYKTVFYPGFSFREEFFNHSLNFGPMRSRTQDLGSATQAI